ncbi:MAG: polysaccharide biosynthesis/export family protein [Xanthobacteraceae bacterium]
MNPYPRKAAAMALALVLPLGACSSGSELPELPPTAASASSYSLGPGDQLDVKVLGADELTGHYTVQNGGTISMLLIGKVRAAGLTANDLEKEIAVKLAEGAYLEHPEVIVSVVTYRPFYILGEVARPGGYPYASGMLVLSAIADAAGYTYRANKDYVIITRNGENGKAVSLTPIQPDDIIRVPERYF